MNFKTNWQSILCVCIYIYIYIVREREREERVKSKVFIYENYFLFINNRFSLRMYG